MSKSIFVTLLLLAQLGASGPQGEQPEQPSAPSEAEPDVPGSQDPGSQDPGSQDPGSQDRASPPPAETVLSPEQEETHEPAPSAKIEDARDHEGREEFYQASDFVDTRVTFALSNKNIFAGPGERITQTSGYRIGTDSDYTIRFLENIHTNFSGYETVSRLVLYKKVEAFWPLWETDVALAALILADTELGRFTLFDSGTYIRLIRKMGFGKEEDVGSFDFTAWPVSADRFRLGFTYLISWGGTAIFPGKLQPTSFTEGAVPGMRLRWRSPKGKSHAFLGYKNALLLARQQGVNAGELVPNHGVLAGGGVTLKDRFKLEMNGGFFQKGSQQRREIEGNQINAYGVSAAASLFEGTYVREASDLRLYQNNPLDPADYLLYKEPTPGSGWFVSLEGNLLAQNLEDPDSPGSEELVPAFAAGLTANLKLEALSITFYAFFQSIDFLLFNVPGFVPFQAIPEAAKTTPELSFSTKLEYAIEALKLRPSLQLGIVAPATYTGAKLDDQGIITSEPGEVRTQIVNQATLRTILPVGKSATPIFAFLLRVPFAFSVSTALAAEVRFVMNDNQPRVAKDSERGEINEYFDDPYLLGFDLKLQAKW